MGFVDRVPRERRESSLILAIFIGGHQVLQRRSLSLWRVHDMELHRQNVRSVLVLLTLQTCARSTTSSVMTKSDLKYGNHSRRITSLTIFLPACSSQDPGHPRVCID